MLIKYDNLFTDYEDHPDNASPTTFKLLWLSIYCYVIPKDDNNLETHVRLFDKHAFILKDERLRYIEQSVPIPPPGATPLGKCALVKTIGPASQRRVII